MLMMRAEVWCGEVMDALRHMADECIDCCVTSPPYWGLRDYGVDGQTGLEATPELFVAKLVDVFREVRRVLRNDGTLWLNLGDSYARDVAKGGSGPNGKHDSIPDYGNARKIMKENNGGSGIKPKDLVGIPWMTAFALRADGWYLRQEIIWAKPNPMPESVRDRCTKAHEHIFLLTKAERYFYDAEAIKEAATCDRLRGPALHGDLKSTNGNGGLLRRDVNGYRNKRSVWTVTPQPFKGAHFATFPPKLIEPCILAGSRPGGLVLDPFAGSGTTAMVACALGRRAALIEINPKYVDIIRQRVPHCELVSR